MGALPSTRRGPWASGNPGTDALAHLLLRYPVLADAFRDHVSSAGVSLPGDVTFRTQAHWQDGAIPDLVGIDKEKKNLLIVESCRKICGR